MSKKSLIRCSTIGLGGKSESGSEEAQVLSELRMPEFPPSHPLLLVADVVAEVDAAVQEVDDEGWAELTVGI